MKAMYINSKDEFYYQLDAWDSIDNYPLGSKFKFKTLNHEISGTVSRKTNTGIVLSDWSVTDTSEKVKEKKTVFPWQRK